MKRVFHIGLVHKWRHPLKGEGIYQKVTLLHKIISKMGDKGEGGVKNLKKWLMSFMDGR